jgi:hypothetical protein
MRVVASDQHIAAFRVKAIANPLGRIVGLKVTCRRERRECVARAPERLRRLAGPKLSAVPHHSRARATSGGFGRKPINLFTSVFRERTTRIDLGSYRVAVVNEIENHGEGSFANVRFFAGRNTNLQAILRQRKRAGCERIESARRIVSLVEIEHRCAVITQIGV